jgi:hypothetical protein
VSRETFRPGIIVSYWHPTKGGWYTAVVERYGRKHARLRAVVPSYVKHKDGTRTLEHRRFRVSVDSVKPATIGGLL